ncbi:helix-turn-helix domain-containing protein [Bacillus toyonensis]|uniref:helix-turn-helix domain-containing protein n=1 Tax=Bacillus toyonensis TaxID=155322 RepID=UPI00159BC022|nr:helix-turn-helix transcriptional regulator [Bacillus toyonensis]
MSKKNFNKKHTDLMDLLNQVPGVKEHMNSMGVRMGGKILKRRLELELTQSDLVKMINDNGDKITQATISKVERGEGTIGSDTYDKIFKVLGGLESIEIEFGKYPKSTESTKRYREEPVLI